jgi:thiamine kinase-like enzyme
MTLTVDEAIRRVPFLRDAQDIRATELKGGITNRNYKVEAGGKAYMLRIVGEDTHLLGIRRDIEYQANLAAGQLGVAPEVLHFIEPEGYLVTRFIDGKRILPEEMTRSDNIRRVVRKIRLFHQRCPELGGEANLFSRVEVMIDACRKAGCKFPADFDWMMHKVGQVKGVTEKNPVPLAPCHADLLNLNFLDENAAGERGEVRILDWELAGMGDIFHDLANFSHHHRFNDDQVGVLLQEYFGEVTPMNFARLKLMWVASEAYEAMWGTTQTAISKLDEDFQGYADLWFGRMREACVDPRWDQWLKDAVRK